MDKKAVARLPQLPAKNGSEPAVKEYGGKKSVPQHGRKREFDRPDPGRKPMAGRSGRTGQRYVRPREKMGGKVDVGPPTPESGSLFCTGGKKQNITHLMNWWGPSHRAQSTRGGGYQGGGARVRRYSSHTPKYSKEHYLQANCQFVVDDREDYSIYAANQDLLVDWKFVEEVRLHVSEAPSCPICLHSPTAAKVTRCGHIYCFPCILHYLALSDKNWRKCPICYEPVVKEDLKSVIAICHKDFAIGEEIELQLMRRERDSLLPMPAASFNQEVACETPRISHPTAATPYAKLLVASKEEVCGKILMREQRDLEAQLTEEGDQPEACFIVEALSLLRTRQDSLSSDSSLEEPHSKIKEGVGALSLSSPEEPSSGDSLSSMEEPISPFSPASGDTSFPCGKVGSEKSSKTVEDATYPTELPPLGSNEEANANKQVTTDEDVPFPSEPQKLGSCQSTHCDKPVITVEDLDISQLQPVNHTSGSQAQRNIPKSSFYFYQARNGAHIYMHAINVQMLVQEYGALENCPPIIKAKVVEKETVSMNEELRTRLRYLRHLPVTCSFDVVEVCLRHPAVSKLTLAMFQDQIEARQRKRNKRAREERRIEKRVRAEEDRLMGRSRGATNLKIESLKQFPSFGEDLPPRASNEVNEGANASFEVHGGEPATLLDGEVLNSSPVDDNNTGISFAKMIREGQTRVSQSVSEPVNIKSVVWPTLGGRASRPGEHSLPKRIGSKTGGGGSLDVSSSTWEIKTVSHLSGPSSQHANDGQCSDEEEEAGSVPEFKCAFSDAVAKALDTAAKKSAGKQESETTETGRKGRKKKKRVVLFSSGGLN